jgi:hypothetical protein
MDDTPCAKEIGKTTTTLPDTSERIFDKQPGTVQNLLQARYGLIVAELSARGN